MASSLPGHLNRREYESDSVDWLPLVLNDVKAERPIGEDIAARAEGRAEEQEKMAALA